jgi:hypothetical protein
MSENDLLDEVAVSSATIKDFAYPLNFEFKIGTMANDFIAKDANGKTLAYVRQKMFKLKEAVSVYSDDSKSELLYKINANKWIDYNASYAFTRGDGDEMLGRVGRRGRKSLLKAHYEIFDVEGEQEFMINEENPWAKVWDALLGEVPVVSMFTGYMFNPKYLVKSIDGTPLLRLKKEPSFFGRKFSLEKLGDIKDEESERVLLSLMMMSLLERRRG